MNCLLQEGNVLYICDSIKVKLRYYQRAMHTISFKQRIEFTEAEIAVANVWKNCQ